MKKLSILLNTGIKTILFLSLVLLGTWTLAQTETVLNEKALEVNYQFLYDYNVNTTHGFSKEMNSILKYILLNEKALEANYQFLYDYNVNTTHGFSSATEPAAVP